MSVYQNGSINRWDDLGHRRGVGSKFSQAPSQATFGRSKEHSLELPDVLRSRLPATNHNAAPPSAYNNRTVKQNAPTAYSKTSRAPAHAGSFLPRSYFKPGLIIRTPCHEPAIPSSTIKTDDLTSSKLGDICSKMRPLIVIACNGETYQALPMYTHGDSGVEKVLAKEEYVSVQDHRNTQPFRTLTMHEPLLTRTITEGVDFYKPNSVCHIAGTVTKPYCQHVKKDGYLTAESVRHLAKLKYNLDMRNFEAAFKI